jgi:hypothetical protein
MEPPKTFPSFQRVPHDFAPDNLLMFAPNGVNLVMWRSRQARNR